MKRILFSLILILCGINLFSQPTQWYKGNLHTHSLWSDGDDFPEMIMDWYKSQGYDFIALSDHNIFAEGEKWIETEGRKNGKEALEKYLSRFGAEWVETKKENGKTYVRLKTFAEYSPKFSEPGKFLLIPSEEITAAFEGRPVHINATNIDTVITPQTGATMWETIQKNVDAVLAQREKTGKPMFPHINHPNFGWAMTPMDLIAVTGERFFEVYNGHPAVNNYGDATRPGMEEMWDIVLTSYIQMGKPLLFGLAVDDSHNYHEYSSRVSNPGRGWVMVKAASLSARDIIAAMEKGDFYSSSGVVIDQIQVRRKNLKISIRPQEGVSYKTYFIGTEGENIGKVLAEADGLQPVYKFSGKELYVRARVVSTRLRKTLMPKASTRPHGLSRCSGCNSCTCHISEEFSTGVFRGIFHEGKCEKTAKRALCLIYRKIQFYFILPKRTFGKIIKNSFPMKSFYALVFLPLLFIFSCQSPEAELIFPDGETKFSESLIAGAETNTEGISEGIERTFPCRMRGVMFPAPDEWECRVLIELETGHLLYPVNISDYFNGEVENPVLIKLSFIQVPNGPVRCGRAIPVELICLTRDSNRTPTIPGRAE
ncbi:MAG: hypothetical protein R3C61_09740 [Bacteroidia bacterium]